MWNSCTSVHEFPTLVHIGIAGLKWDNQRNRKSENGKKYSGHEKIVPKAYIARAYRPPESLLPEAVNELTNETTIYL